MKSKSIKFRCKLHALCGLGGYPYRLDIYSGKTADAHCRFGLDGNVVVSLVDIAKDMAENDIEFFFNNYFTNR